MGSKLDYPKFSGKFSECFLKFKDKMVRAFKSNRVAKVDQVDKLREQLSGFALSLVPDSQKDIDVAFQALSDQWGDPESVLDSRLKELRGLGKLPPVDQGYQKQIQWYLSLDGVIQDILDLGDRGDDLADEAFKQITLRDVMNFFPDKIHLKLTSLPGRRRQKLAKIKDQLKTYRSNAQILDKERKVEGGSKPAGAWRKGQGYGGGHSSGGGQKSQTAHPTFAKPGRFDSCRVCGVLETQGKADLYEGHFSSWPTECPQFIKMTAEERFDVVIKAKMCRSCQTTPQLSIRSSRTCRRLAW